VTTQPVATLTADEDSRAQKDPDYRWLLSDIAAIDTVREQHSVSLNLKTRKEERTKLEKERLDRENSRRAAKNLAPFKSVEEIDKDKTELPDVVLSQAAEIMADMLTGARPTPSSQQKTARRG
jgi:carboxyl-terminal processing protease